MGRSERHPAAWAWAGLVTCLLAVQTPWAAPAPASVPGDPAAAGLHCLRVFRDVDGLPQNTVHAVALDAGGHLWAGTQDGAAHYDGRTWTVVDMPSRSRSNFVRSILAAADGSVWFGTQAGGLHRSLHGEWLALPPTLDSPAFARVNALLETRSPAGPRIWVGTHDGGVLLLDGERVTVFDTRAGLPANRVWALSETRDASGATLWVGTEAGVARLRAGASRFQVEPGLPRVSVNSLLETPGDLGSTLWAGTYGAGLARLTAAGWTLLTVHDGLPSNHMTSLALGHTAGGEPVVWAGTDGGGVARLQGGRIEVVSVAHGLPSSAVYCLLETDAPQGTHALWVGTRNGGLARLKEGLWRSFRPTPAVAPYPVNAVVETHERGGSVMWFGTDGGGLARLASSGWTVLTRDAGGIPSDIVQCLLATGQEGEAVIWVGTRNGGLGRLAGGRWTTYTRGGGELPNDMVQTLLETAGEDGRRVLWVGTRGGLARLEGGRWYPNEGASVLPRASVLSLLETAGAGGRRTLWVGTAGGLARLDEGRWRALGDDSDLANQAIQTLAAIPAADGRRHLWIGTDGGGVGRLDLDAAAARIEVISDASSPPLPNNVVYTVLADRSGRVYLPTNRGVARLTPAAAGYEVFTYTMEDGLPRNQGSRNAGLVDSRGRIWVGTIGGAAVFDPDLERPDLTPKRLELAGAAVGHGVVPSRAALDHTRDHLVFTFSLLSFFREKDTRYRTQLVGLDAEPSAWHADGKKEYRRLPGGRYAFRVWGRDYAGNVTGPAETTFTIHPPPWQSGWALGLGLAAVTLGGWLALRARLHAHQRRERDLQALVDARTRELREANYFLQELSYLDPVTAIANRRRFDERLQEEWKRAIRTATSLSLIMVDIDLFKAYNDTYGHQAGDDCLRRVAAALADSLPRAGDSVARYGGEEFAIILPVTDRTGAQRVGEQLRQRVEALAIPHRTSTVARAVTISCGVATFVPTLEIEPDELLRLADEALYRAKQGGRNRTRAEHGEPRSSVVLAGLRATRSPDGPAKE